MQGSNQNSNGKHHKLLLRAERSWRASHRIASHRSSRAYYLRSPNPRITTRQTTNSITIAGLWQNESPRRSKIDSISLARREGRIWEGPEETNLPEAAVGSRRSPSTTAGTGEGDGESGGEVSNRRRLPETRG
jgi:hypothetical protein